MLGSYDTLTVAGGIATATAMDQYQQTITVAGGTIRDIRVGVAFDVLNVVSGTASGRVQHGRLGVCLLTGLHYARALRLGCCSSLAFEPI
jgi:hypothetical protein